MVDLNIEHLAGNAIDGIVRFFDRKKIDSNMVLEAELSLRPHLKRFSILATIITGKAIRVVGLVGDARPRPYLPILRKISHTALLHDHGFPWTDGETFYLPISMVDMPNVELQEALAKAVIFFLSMQIKEGSLGEAYKNASLLESDVLLADIYWIIENARLSKLLSVEYPAMASSVADITQYLIKKRPESSHMNEAERRVEELFCLYASNGDVIKADSAEESFIRAREIKDGLALSPKALKRYRAVVPFTPWGRLIVGRIKDAAATTADGDELVSDSADSGDSSDSGENQRSKDSKAKSRYMAKKETLNEDDNDQGLALNIYDKIISWARFVNLARPFDDDPEEDIVKTADEMEELTVAEVEKRTNSSFNAELDSGEEAGDKVLTEEEDINGKEEVSLYPEWDYKLGAYKEDFSRVIESITEDLGNGFVEGVLVKRSSMVKAVKRKFEALNPATRSLRRQVEGDDIDIDAVVEARADTMSGHQADDRLYIVRQRVERDISVLFLMDMSMSTDAWVGSGRVIDHEKEAMAVLCEAMSELRERYAIYSFSGRTRKSVRVMRVKGFKEDYDNTIKGRLGGVIPYHYTRMGPAIRHVTEILGAESATIRLLFLISDGKPNDMDRYEGRYGIEDTRKAIKEAEAAGIVPFCLTVDREAHEYLPHLFGRGNYAVVSSVEKLTQVLPDLYARIVKNL
ncbi:MAG: hypothetical protein KAS88_03055 [Deltaproteobacteria bacterium]|nr:hypothetical protein [Deltaproteobacteria bacterium]